MRNDDAEIVFGGHNRQYGAIAAPTPWCFVVPSEFLGKAGNGTNYTPYDLEDIVPLDAEEIGLIRAGRLLVACDLKRLHEFWQNTNDGRATCISIVPRALAAIQSRQRELEPSRRELFIVGGEEQADVVRLEKEDLASWEWGPCDSEQLVQRIRTLCEESDEGELSVHCIGLDESIVDSFKQLPVRLTSQSESASEFSQRFLQRIAGGEDTSRWQVESVPNGFVRPEAAVAASQSILMFALLLGLAIVGSGLYWRSAQLQAGAVALADEQEQAFKKCFPKQKVPQGVLTRLESECRKLKATVTQGDSIPKVESVVPALVAFLNAFPSDASISIDQVRVSGNTLEQISGVAKSYEDLDLLRRSLIEQSFEVPPVSTVKSPRGLSVSIEHATFRETADTHQVEAKSTELP